MFSETSRRRETDSELYLPGWVRCCPETVIRSENKKEVEKRRKRKCKRKYNLYSLREVLDDNIVQKLEEANFLTLLIKRGLDGELSRKIKLRALKRSIFGGMKEYESDELDEITKDESTENNAVQKFSQQKIARKKLFRDRLIWETMNEWKKPPPTEKAENIYSQNFITYLGNVKLPGKKQNLNELENLYKTYQEIVVPKENRTTDKKKVRKRDDKSIRKTVKRHHMHIETNKNEKLGIKVEISGDKTEESMLGSDFEEKEQPTKRIESLKLFPLHDQQKVLLINPRSSREEPTMMNSSPKYKKVRAGDNSSAELPFPLKERLSLSDVFRKKASLNSLTRADKTISSNNNNTATKRLNTENK